MRTCPDKGRFCPEHGSAASCLDARPYPWVSDIRLYRQVACSSFPRPVAALGGLVLATPTILCRQSKRKQNTPLNWLHEAWLRPWLGASYFVTVLVCMNEQNRPTHPALAPRSMLQAAPPELISALALGGCARLFLDGGSNDGDSVRAFTSGHFFNCAMNGPHRLYTTAWKTLPRKERVQKMAPLSAPAKWCIRSFEASPDLMPSLHEEEARLRAAGFDVRFVDAALSNTTAASAPRQVVKYARNKWGSTATTLPFDEIFPGGKPPQLASRTVHGPSLNTEELLEHALALNRSSVIALKLDVRASPACASAAVAQPIPPRAAT